MAKEAGHKSLAELAAELEDTTFQGITSILLWFRKFSNKCQMLIQRPSGAHLIALAIRKMMGVTVRAELESTI